MKITKEHLSNAIDLAVTEHLGQYDKSGMPYILHPLRVMDRVRRLTMTHMIVAVLHDSVEDTSITIEYIREHFGDTVADAVDAITHRPNEPKKEYWERVKNNHFAKAVKLEDIHDNMRYERLETLDEETRERLLQKYMMALIFLARGKEKRERLIDPSSGASSIERDIADG